MNKSKIFKQRLYALHMSSGITFSIIMYLSIFFGVFTIFLPFIQTWEKPSRYIQTIDITKVDYNYMIEKVLENKDFPKDNILITLPGEKVNPTLQISNKFVDPIVFNPFTKQIIQEETSQVTNLAIFFKELHYGGIFGILGEISFGLVAIGSLGLIISGLIFVSLFKFSSKIKNNQSLFSKIHTKIFTWLFLPLLLICISGAVMNIALISSYPMSKILTKGKASSIDEVVGSVLFTSGKIIKKANKKASMKDLSSLLIKAKKINNQLVFKEIKLINWNDENAQARFIGYNPYKPFLNSGVFNIPYVSLNAHTGELIENKTVLSNVWPVFVAEALFFLHFLFSIDIFSRILLALVMLLSAIAIGFAVMLWLEKKAKDFKGNVFYHWMAKLSLFSMIGVIPASAMLFVSQWALAFSLEDRFLWQEGIFYNTWLFTLFWSFYRINSFQASKEFFFSSGILFFLAVILHFVSLDLNPLMLISNNMLSILSVDIALILFGIIFIYISKKLPKNRDEFLLINIQKENNK